MGPVQRVMLKKLKDSPNGESGFRRNEISSAAIKNGEVKYVYESGRITWYAITEKGHAALQQFTDRHGTNPVNEKTAFTSHDDS
jgi:hypothetical protein